MNITATLIGQILTFAVLVWFVKAVLWEPMVNMLEDRKRRIADGLAAAERGKQEQELAQDRAQETIDEAKQKAADIIAAAQRRSTEMIEEAKVEAKNEGERIKSAAQAEAEQELNKARESLRSQVGTLVISGAEKILRREVDDQAHKQTLDELAAQI